MKKELLISSLLGIAGLAVVLFFLINKPQINTLPTEKPQITITAEEVQAHAIPTDCWVIVENKAYDVTSLIDTHSGGAGTIIPNCGGDATGAFATKNRNEPHSEMAKEDLQSMYVGDIQ
jgi:cytochrome b involved in lipid metabolism